MTKFKLNRRQAIIGLSSSVTAFALSGPAVAANLAGKKIVMVFLRGGTDGLGVLAPIADPNYAGLRRQLAMTSAQTLSMGGGFGLNPNMPNIHQMVLNQEAIFVSGIGAPYHNRSHFDGQEGVERGVTNLADRRDGWLSRALVQMGVSIEGIAIGTRVPKMLSGEANILNYAPARLPPLDADTMNRIASLTATDSLIGPPITQIVDDTISGRTTLDVPNNATDFEIAAALLNNQDPQLAGIVMVDMGGWDTHDNAWPLTRNNARVAQQCALLDNNIQALKTGLGASWANTVVMVVSEFGRNVEVNGSDGLDHGIGGLAMLAGGAVNGLTGGVRGDFAGLAPGSLVDGQDLAISTDMRAIFKGVLRDHLGMTLTELNNVVFPNSSAIAPMDNLIL